MSIPNTYDLERELLPELRRQILFVENLATRAALFSLLGLVHDLASELAREREKYAA